jgi:hypothetical protein
MMSMDKAHHTHRFLFLTAALACLALAVLPAAPAQSAEPTWPSAYEVWRDAFDGPGLSDMWEDYGDGHVEVTPAAASGGSPGGLSVDVSGEDQRYLQLYNLTPWPHLEFPRDTYVRFLFHPNGVSIPDGETVSLLRMRDGDWNVMAGLRLSREGDGYSVFLELPDGTMDEARLSLTGDWHSLVVGVRMNDWVGLWVDGDQERVVTGMSHAADFVQVLIVGKADGNWSGSTPSGTVFFDDLTLLFAAYGELWVDAASGDDGNEGDDPSIPLRTLGAAALLTSPGTTVHVAPGDYRESLVMPVDGTAEEPVRLVADGGRGTARILGSDPASSAEWSRLTDPAEIDLPAGVDPASAGIWKADLSGWELEHAPTFVMIREADGTLTRLPAAREPDWHVETEWKHHEFWWAAEGGSGVVTCDPAADRDCDEPQRADNMLVDFSDDPAPAGIEPGSLASLGDVTGAVVYVKGTVTGHYTYRRLVVETPEPGRIRLEALPEAYFDGCWFDHDPSMPNLGWNSKYFLEGLAGFMDTPGEWIFDSGTQTLYVWTPDGRSPAETGVEISVRQTGVDLSHRSNMELRDLDILLFEEQGLRISNSGSEDDRSHNIVLAGLDIGWSTRGLKLEHGPQPGTAEGSQIRHFVLRDSRVHDMESLAIYFWSGSGRDFVRPGITDALFVHNEFARIGFRDNEQGSVGMSFQMADHFLFEGNHVHHIAHNGVHFSKAYAQSSPGYNVPADQILTGDVLVRGNLFEDCVQNATDAGGLKFWGAVSDRSHTFRDVLVTGNVSRNNVGWAWVSEQRRNWTYNGKGGMGYYIDFAGGIHFFRNIAYENGLAGFMASGSWIDQPVVLANNTIVSSPVGYTMGTRGAFADATVGLDMVNTIFLHMRRFAISVGQAEILQGSVRIDSDLFFLNGWEEWPSHTPGILSGHVDDSGYSEHPTLADVQALGYEAGGVEGDPMLAGFDPAIEDGTWQDFRLTSASTLALDRGAELPASLAALLEKFGMTDGRLGAALDRGALELDPADPDAPFTIDVGPTDGSRPIEAPWGDDFPDPPVNPPDNGGGEAGCGCRIPGSGTGDPGLPASLLLILAIVMTMRGRRNGRPRVG